MGIENLERIKPDSMTYRELINDIDKGKIKIPEFQRDVVWGQNEFIELLDSVYRHYPVGSFLFWRTDTAFFPFRNIGNIELPKPPPGPIDYVLDGQQRITALYASYKEATIEIRVNRKIVRRKIELFFDLDEKRFISKRDLLKEVDRIDKVDYIAMLPRGLKGGLLGTLTQMLTHVKENSPGRESFIKWMENELGLQSYLKEQSLTMLLAINLVKEEKFRLVISPLASDFLVSESPDVVLVALLQNVNLMDKTIELILSNQNNSRDDIYNQLKNDNGQEKWLSSLQVYWRLKWLEKLGYIKLNSKKSDFEVQIIQNDRLQQIFDGHQKKQSALLGEDRDRYVTVMELIDSSLMRSRIRGLSDERYNSYSDANDSFTKYDFPVIFVKEQSIGTVCSIFERINTTGKKLDIVDLLAAKTWSPNFNLRVELDELVAKLRNYKFGDIQHNPILQSLSMLINKKCRKKDILTLERQQIMDNWLNLSKSLTASIEFLNNHLNIRNGKILPFSSIIVPLSYFYFKKNGQGETTFELNQLKKFVWRASFANRFDSSVESKLEEDVERVEKILSGELPQYNYGPAAITFRDIMDQEMDLGSAFCKSILCLYSYNEPRNLSNNSPVNLDSINNWNQGEFHHIFPQGYLKKIIQAGNMDDIKKSQISSHVNSVVNICIIKSNENKSISDKAPSEYMETFIQNNPDIRTALKSHYIVDIDKSMLLKDDFDKFINYRASIILDNIQAVCGELSPIQSIAIADDGAAIDTVELWLREFIDAKMRKFDEEGWKNYLQSELGNTKAANRIKAQINKTLVIDESSFTALDYHEIFEYYLDIIMKNWAVFEPHFLSKPDTDKHFKQFADYRNAVKHLRPMDDMIKLSGRASLIWFERAMKNVNNI